VPHELQQFIGTVRVVLNVEDEIEATLTMDRLQTECEGLLDEEDGDEVIITQITPFTTDVSPEEVLTIFRRARNALIRTRVKDCFDIARSLDMVIYNLAIQQDPTMSTTYDYSRMMGFLERILLNKEEPNE
jgi:hypothetical protein